ncbi:uncharacterized protein IL334_007498 [Kwoniella shivajii]|uniref:Solute carrier family 39 (Zinc transporter), member 1/2/3 n=1 Tax=Kwoniella shivajii TaxID=564305 RepID=A0ABZ1D9C4_9TREE|nr:hypothetical protein IL334_007498 [Kwoniella shivajii]
MPTIPSPSSSSTSTTETTLPTPDQSYSSRRSSVASPYIYSYGMSENLAGDEGDLFSPLGIQIGNEDGAETPKGKGMLPSTSVEPEHSSHLNGNTNGISSPTPFSRRRSNTGNRAPPPPPIFLRKATGMQGDDEDEMVPIPGSASTASGSVPSSAKGLNITGMSIPTLTSPTEIERIEGDEEGEEDALPELMASPRPRLNFNSAEGAPASPAWQSFEAPSSAGLNPSSSWGRKTSLDVPSPLGPRNNERKFEPTPQHGIHARNLSLFFPQPGNPIPQRQQNGSPMLMESPVQPNETLIPSAKGDRNVFGGSGSWSFGQAPPTDEGDLQTPENIKKSKRRGHHHKHSLSHNFFSFLDPTHTNPSLATSPSPKPPSTPGPEATPAPVPMPSLGVSALASPTLSPLPPSKSDPKQQFLLSFAVLEFLIGAGLWVEGQMSGWRCLAGVGYLVVFDAIGVAVEMVARNEGQGWNTIRRPYGPSRYISLLYFTQSLFLVFSAVYIAKEAIEQVVLGSGAHEHAVGGHGHGESVAEGDERDFPHFLLACAALASTFAGGVLGNHGKLVDAVGSLFLTSTYLSLPFVSRFSSLLANPFSLTIAGVSAGIGLSSLIVPPSALHSLDSFISLILTILTCALSYPPTVAFAHVLLQTAPASTQTQMTSLRKAIKDIKDDRRVLGLGTMRCWMITAGKGSFEDRYEYSTTTTPTHSRSVSASGSGSFSTPSSPKFFNQAQSPSFKQFSFDTPSSYPSAYGNTTTNQQGQAKNKDDGASLVVTLIVHVHPDSSDRDILEITKMSYTKLEYAISSNPGGLGINRRDGEVSISIKRGWEGLEDG